MKTKISLQNLVRNVIFNDKGCKAYVNKKVDS